MDYKTTYFTLSYNSEISIGNDEYDYRINKKKLMKEISEIEAEDKNYKGKTVTALEKILAKETSYSSDLKRLIKLKRMLQNIENKRFTEQDQLLLNKHLSKIASEGWKLISMQPILKGLYDYSVRERRSYGYGHNVTEGFVMVWEKI